MEVSSNRTSNSKVVCCHFSSDGKLLASAGHEKKVLYMVFVKMFPQVSYFDMSTAIRKCLNHSFQLG